MKNSMFAVLLGAVMLWTSGCATADRSNAGMKRPIFLDSEPQGAQVFKEDGTYIGSTPVTHLASPRKENTLVFRNPGYQPRTVVIRAERWGQSAPLNNAGNMAASAIIPPVGAAMFAIDHWGTQMDKDFQPLLVKLYPENQAQTQVAEQPAPSPVPATQPHQVVFQQGPPTVVYQTLPGPVMQVFTQAPPVTVYLPTPNWDYGLRYLPGYKPNTNRHGMPVATYERIEAHQEAMRKRQGTGAINSLPPIGPVTLRTTIFTNPPAPPTTNQQQGANSQALAPSGFNSAPSFMTPAPTTSATPTNSPAVSTNYQSSPDYVPSGRITESQPPANLGATNAAPATNSPTNAPAATSSPTNTATQPTNSPAPASPPTSTNSTPTATPVRFNSQNLASR